MISIGELHTCNSCVYRGGHYVRYAGLIVCAEVTLGTYRSIHVCTEVIFGTYRSMSVQR